MQLEWVARRGRSHRDLSQSAKGWRLIGLERALFTFGAAGRDVSVQAVQVLENVLECICHGLFEGAVGFAPSLFQGAEEFVVLCGIAGHGTSLCRPRAGSRSQVSAMGPVPGAVSL